MYTAKVFKNGRSQAIRIPKEFRMPSDQEIKITRLGNCVILQPIPKTWMDVYHAMKAIDADDIVRGEDLPPQERRWFE